MKRGRNQRRRQGVNPNRALDSNGPDVRIRGTANQIYDKYLALARDASSSGDRVKAENYLQHAEHYFRLIRSMQAAQQPTPQPAADGGTEQPAVPSGEGEQAEDRKPARKERGNGAEAAEDAQDSKAEEAGTDEAKAEEQEEERKPRRRRQPRRTKKESAEEAPAAAAE